MLHRMIRLLLISTSLINISFAQTRSNKTLDSLLSIVQLAATDTGKINALTSITRYYYGRGQFDSARIYSWQALQIAEANNDKKNMGRAYYNLGLSNTSLTRYDSAAYYLTKSLSMGRAGGDTALIAHSLQGLALSAQYQSDHRTAVDYLLQQLTITQAGNNPRARAIEPQTYSNIGFNLIAMDETDRGIGYIKQSLQFRNYPDENRFRVSAYLTLADVYMKERNYSQARLYLDSAVVTNATLNNIQLRTLVANTEGSYYKLTNDTLRALEAYERAYRYTDTSRSDYLRAEVAENLAGLYLSKKDLSAARRFAREASDIGLRLKHYRVVANSLAVLSILSEQSGDFRAALEYERRSNGYRDSVRTADSRKAALVLESKYQDQRRESEITALKLSNRENELNLLRRNRLLLLLGVGAALILLIMFFVGRTNRQKRIIAEKENRLQQEQMKLLREQQQVVSLQSMINGQETERSRIAKDLHDGLGGLFSTVKMHLSSLRHEREELGKNELLEKSVKLVDTASVEIRRIAHNMMPEVLMKMGLVDAVNDMCNHVNAGKLLYISLQAYGMERRLPAATEIMLYRILQELINNIIRHSGATAAIVQFNRNGNRLTITVEDNGRGFDAVGEGKHAGLATIQSRVTYLDGKMAIESEDGLGTTVMMDFLLEDKMD